MDLLVFANLMDEIGKDIPKHVEETKRAVALEVLTEVASSTPADTGQAISNWLVGIGQEVTQTITPHDPGQFGSTLTANVRATIAAGSGLIAQSIQDKPIFISNNLDYIEELNSGSSSQAPAAFVESAMIRGAEKIGTVKIVP